LYDDRRLKTIPTAKEFESWETIPEPNLKRIQEEMTQDAEDRPEVVTSMDDVAAQLKEYHWIKWGCHPLVIERDGNNYDPTAEEGYRFRLLRAAKVLIQHTRGPSEVSTDATHAQSIQYMKGAAYRVEARLTRNAKEVRILSIFSTCAVV
jgi:hypothetical protein